MKGKVKETTKIVKHDRLASSTIVEEEYYAEEDVNKITGKISDGVNLYMFKHGRRPLMIMISRQLELFMIHKIEILNKRQMFGIGDEPIILNTIFGIPVLTTPVLDGLEFKIY